MLDRFSALVDYSSDTNHKWMSLAIVVDRRDLFLSIPKVHPIPESSYVSKIQFFVGLVLLV